jgi:hypothetical protein
MRRDAPASVHARTLLRYRGEKDWRSRLGVKDDRVPLVAVLSASGEIVWSREGAYSREAASEALEALGR